MRLDEPVGTKFKRVCADFTDIAVLTKRATMGEIQVTFCHMSIGEIPSEKLPLPLTLQFPQIANVGIYHHQAQLFQRR